MLNDLYVVLGVGVEAAPDEVKSGYQRFAKELNPNRYGPDAPPFGEAQEAFAGQSDSGRRRVYDDRIEAGRQSRAPIQGPRAEPLRPRGFVSSRSRAISRAPVQTYQPSFDELFERLWSNFTSVSRPKAERLESLTLEIHLTAEESMKGGRAQIMIPARARCPVCLGRGAAGPYECWHCLGQGAITADFPLEVVYPPSITNEYMVQVPLTRFGIENFYLTVRFRVVGDSE
jgi:molecular chaperone DnaJ